MSEERKFYKWSVKWSNGEYNHTFYRPGNSGYTCDLNSAGVYSEDEIQPCEPIIETEQDVYDAKYNNPDRHPVFAIPVEKVGLLGKKMLVVQN